MRAARLAGLGNAARRIYARRDFFFQSRVPKKTEETTLYLFMNEKQRQGQRFVPALPLQRQSWHYRLQ